MLTFFIRHNRFSYILLAALIGLGIYTLTAIPRESSPEVQIPVGIVTTVLPGAPAVDVETLVTNEIERGLIGTLQNVKEISSVSREGVSSVTVEFEASADIDESINDLKDEIDTIAVDLPGTAEDPFVSEVDFVDQPIMNIALAANVPTQELRELANELEKELEALTGVSRVVTTGVPDREVTVVVNPASLLTYGITLQDVVNNLRQANSAFPVGNIENDGTLYSIAFEGDITNTSLIASMPVGTKGGQAIYVHDVAEIIDGLAPQNNLSRLSVAAAGSQPAFSLDVYKQSGGDITKIAALVRERLNELQTEESLLANVTVETLYDSGQDINDDLVQLSSSGLQTIILVMVVLVVAIGWREALIAGAAIPLSFLLGFIGLYFSGKTINFLSLFALILGIGILVDSGIVMVEGINRRLKDNPTIDKREAAIAAIHEFAAPLIAGTLTTVSMFAGLFIVSGVTGQFIASIPFTLIFVLFSSLFVALAILPLFSATFLKRRSATGFERKQNELAHKLESWYAGKLRLILQSTQTQKRFMWLVRGLLVLALLLPVTGLVKVIFFEQGDVPFIYVEAELPVGTPITTSDITAREIEEVLYTHPDIASFQTTVGAGSQFGSGGSGEDLVSIFINLGEEREKSSSVIVTELQEQMQHITSAQITVSQPNNGPPTGSPISVRFIGDDLATLTSYTAQAATILRQIDGSTNVTTSANKNAVEYVINFDHAKAARYGLTTQSVSSVVRSAVYGTEATSVTTLSDDVSVVVKLELSGTPQFDSKATNQANVSDIENLQLLAPTGQTIALGTVASISVRESQSSITHIDGNRVMTVGADVLPEVSASDVQNLFLEKIDSELAKPAGITIDTGGGESEESNRAFLEMFAALIVGVLLMIGVLVLQFNSFRHTQYVISILPYSLIGILFGLAITGNTLSFPSLMGFIALSGIVVNNSILLIDMMNHLRRTDPDMSIETVVTKAASNRLRPILLTTLTTVIGMIPLTYADDIWSPLAYAVMFGLLFSVVITLVLIPILYYRKPGTVSSIPTS